MDTTTTARLFSILQSTDNEDELQLFLEKIDPYQQNLDFQSYFTMLLEKYKKDKAAVIAGSNIERTYGYQIISGLKKPGRDKVILLALSVGCSLDETQRLLRAAQAPLLYSKNRRDAVIIFSINKSLSPGDANALLEEFEMSVLN